jgi:hypothetical protein
MFARLLFGLFLVPAVGAGAEFWSPVNPDELNLKTPKVQKDAAAEVLFWETRLENDINSGHGSTVVSHYLRIKIFTEKGREVASEEIPYGFGKTISGVAGRTVKADGTIHDLKSDAVFNKEVVKVGGRKIRAVTFVLPDVSPGDVIEYRYKENWEGLIQYIRLPMQRTIPVEKASFRLRPLSRDYTSYSMRVQTFHREITPFALDREGYSCTAIENVPAYKTEPYMPPEDAIRAFMLVYYSEQTKLAPAKFWADYGHRMYSGAKASIKSGDEVKRQAEQLVAGETTPSGKLSRLYDFCQHKIRNSNTIQVTADERKAMKPNKSPSDTLRQGMGTGSDIDNLFAALATAAGFDARPAISADRGDGFFDPNFPDPYFLNARNIAVKVGDKWTFCDPANRYVPFGMLRWQEEAVNALIADPDKPEWVSTQITPASQSKIVHAGKFRLSEDGTLEGDVKVSYQGHQMVVRRAEQEQESIEKRKKDYEEGIMKRLPGAEVSNLNIENPEGSEPLIYTYHVKVPGYASRTGRRLFLEPAFFQHNTLQLFPNGDRKYGVYFDYPWSEQDNIEIDVPDGYTLDHADAPSPINGGKVFQYQVKMQFRNRKTLVYSRDFLFESLLIPVEHYATLKQLFDTQFKSDEHQIALMAPAASGALRAQ